MITSQKLFLLLTGSASAAVVGAGPAVHSETALTALLVGGAATVAAGLVQVVRAAPAKS